LATEEVTAHLDTPLGLLALNAPRPIVMEA
jgi:hypothetical protein